jgi:hypothetical protein
MTDSNAFQLLGKALRRSALTWALPHLVQLPSAEWDEALKQARETSFDAIERIGVLAAIVFTTYLLRFDANESELSLPIRFVAQFVAAVPLLSVLAGPFCLRCLRRGLDHVIEHRRLAG